MNQFLLVLQILQQLQKNRSYQLYKFRFNKNLFQNIQNSLMQQSPQSSHQPDLQYSTNSNQQQNSAQMQLKQQYLREQILQKNFNAEDFIQYLNQKLNIDSDISKCSFQQLKKVVKSYIAKIKKHQIHMSQFDNNSQSMRSSMFESVASLPPVVMVKLSSEPLIMDQQFTDVVKCLAIQQKYRVSQIKQKGIQCVINSPTRKFVTSILGINTSSYLEFRIRTFGFGWEVGRRYSDFIWLRSTLRRFYPSQVIPPIPNKKAHKRTSRQLERRMKILTLFLNQLLTYPQFLNSKYLQGFLSYPQSKFSSFKKQIDNKKSFQSITTTQTISGQVQISLNKQILDYNRQLVKWTQQSQIQLKQLTRNSKIMQKGIVDQVNTLYSMGDQLAFLHSGTQKIAKLDKRPNNGFYKLKQIYVTLNNLMIEWGSALKNQIELIQTNCNTIYKYIRESLSGYRELITQMKQNQSTYLEAKHNLDMQKQKLFALHDIQKWDIPKKQIAFIPKTALYQKKQAFSIMLPKESSTVEKLKLSYSYSLSRIYENINESLSRKAAILCSSMQEFTIKQKVSNQQMGQLWNQMAYNFTHAFQQKTQSKINKKLNIRTQQKIRKDQTDVQNNQEPSLSGLGSEKYAND